MLLTENEYRGVITGRTVIPVVNMELAIKKQTRYPDSVSLSTVSDHRTKLIGQVDRRS